MAKEHHLKIEGLGEEALAVMTRQQRRRQLEEETHLQEENDLEEETHLQEETNSGEKTNADEETNLEEKSNTEEEIHLPEETNMEQTITQVFPYDQDLFELTTKIRNQRTRREKRLYNQERSKIGGIPHSIQLKNDQEKDEEIQAWLKKEDPSRIVNIEGILCRIWNSKRTPEDTYQQIILPKQYRDKVIRLAHDLPFSGHLGREKTTQRILRRFYWPTLFKDVRAYCDTCKDCQIHSSHKTKAPMVPLPIIGEPFRRIAMDIVGPLPRTSRGNRFILVITDYATRYPEAFPLQTITAKKVAEVLIELFARHGIPEEILTDQGTNFTSNLLGELYQLIGVKAIRTSPYHPQTDGLVERFNRTLKSMLRRVLEGEKRKWDYMLPYVLFAYREVPQATLGFSPFELLYGREVRGPLDILKEEWIYNQETESDVLSFVMDIRERMQQAKEVVQQNAEYVKERQKQYYDRSAREVEFKAGEKVLLLLPTSSVARWQGPYVITKRTGRVTYEILLSDKGNRRQIFHVNHLRKWKERTCQINAVIEEGNEIEGYRWPETEDIHFGTNLPPDKREDITSLLKRFDSITRKTPGKTDKVKHRIRTVETIPIRQKPYRIPQAYRSKVIEELDEMERDGIIEKSVSEWSSPLVIVTKKDGGIRLCVDYRQLNRVTKFDAYPMPRIEELLDSIGDSRFITTLDLAKGYWQVPMSEEDKEKTAFTSPKGLYQFTTMPFGLSGAPATFQRMMDEVLRGTESYSGVYLDDIVVHSSTWSDHINHITEIFKRLEKAGLTIKLAKCTFGTSHCTYLGYQIGHGGVKPELQKVEAISKMATPKTKKDVRAFLGITGYYRRFIKDYATIAEPLTELTRKNAPEIVKWTGKDDLALQRLKSILTTAPLMRNPDFNRTFILQTDASGVGIGAVLSQGEEQTEDQPIAYFSRKLLPREQAYSTVEKECLAIVLAIKHFKAYLLGRTFLIQTDHRALQWLNQFKEKNSRLTRWSLTLQPYNFIIQHRKGQANANADALSRICEDKEHFVPEKEGGNVKDSPRTVSQVLEPSKTFTIIRPEYSS